MEQKWLSRTFDWVAINRLAKLVNYRLGVGVVDLLLLFLLLFLILLVFDLGSLGGLLLLGKGVLNLDLLSLHFLFLLLLGSALLRPLGLLRLLLSHEVINDVLLLDNLEVRSEVRLGALGLGLAFA
ncbi:hypothetical protein PFISCL1PPCAC_4737, partial [Pristionchus fissidentatus]